MKIYISTIISVLILQSAFSQTKVHTKINFIHGMKGNGQSLLCIQKAMAAWPNDFTKSYWINTTEVKVPVTYSSSNGINSSSKEIGAIFANDLNYFNSTKRILIAHSLGGLVARDWYSRFKTATDMAPCNGIITLCTPHKGAPVATKLQTSEGRTKFDNEIKAAMLNITWGPRVSTLDELKAIAKNETVNFIIGVADATGVESILNKIVGKIADNIMNTLLTQISVGEYVKDKIAGSEAILQDLAEESSPINYIQNYDKNQSTNGYDKKTFKIAIVGVEKEKSIFKMIGAAIAGKQFGDNYSLKKDFDLTLTNILDNIEIEYLAKAKALRDNKKWYTNGYRLKDRRYKASAYEASANYINVDFHIVLEVLLGLRATDKDGKPVKDPVENDGLVPLSSQEAYDGAYVIKMDNMNHEEIKFHVKTDDVLWNLFSGTDEKFKLEAPQHAEFYRLRRIVPPNSENFKK